MTTCKTTSDTVMPSKDLQSDGAVVDQLLMVRWVIRSIPHGGPTELFPGTWHDDFNKYLYSQVTYVTRVIANE